MRVDVVTEDIVTIRLSRRNVITLLYQLDNCRGFDRGLHIRNNGYLLTLLPEPDEQHYADQGPGWMPYEIQEYSKKLAQRIALYDGGEDAAEEKTDSTG